MIAANPGPAAHIALLGAVILISVIVYAIVRLRRKREAAEAEKLNQSAINEPDLHEDHNCAGHHHR